MMKINVQEAEMHLSDYLSMLKVGKEESILICEENTPIAELHALYHSPLAPRPIGLAKGTFEVPSTFFDELPSDVISGFLGGNAA